MLFVYHASVGDLILGSIAALCVVFVVYLAHLEVKERRRNRRRARCHRRLGMIQNITATGAAVGKELPQIVKSAPALPVPRQDSRARRWTSPPKTPTVSSLWN